MNYTWNDIVQFIHSWLEWEDAKRWAKRSHPAWVQLATQYKRPEIRETYRHKIIDEYNKTPWILR